MLIHDIIVEKNSNIWHISILKLIYVCNSKITNHLALIMLGSMSETFKLNSVESKSSAEMFQTKGRMEIIKTWMANLFCFQNSTYIWWWSNDYEISEISKEKQNRQKREFFADHMTIHWKKIIHCWLSRESILTVKIVVKLSANMIQTWTSKQCFEISVK